VLAEDKRHMPAGVQETGQE